MIDFIVSSANNQQSVIINRRQTIAKLMSPQLANREPGVTHSPQSPFGPVCEGRTHSGGRWSLRWERPVAHSTVLPLHPGGMSSLSSWKAAVRCLFSLFPFRQRRLPTGIITAATLAPAPVGTDIVRVVISCARGGHEYACGLLCVPS